MSKKRLNRRPYNKTGPGIGLQPPLAIGNPHHLPMDPAVPPPRLGLQGARLGLQFATDAAGVRHKGQVGLASDARRSRRAYRSRSRSRDHRPPAQPDWREHERMKRELEELRAQIRQGGHTPETPRTPPSSSERTRDRMQKRSGR